MGSKVILAITQAQKDILVTALDNNTKRWDHTTRAWYKLQDKGWMKDNKLTTTGRAIAAALNAIDKEEK